MSEATERYSPNTSEVAAKVIDGEAIIINLTTGVYYSMDEVGGRIWSLLEGRHPVGFVVEEIVAEYDVDAETAGKDVAALIEQLVEEGLISATDLLPDTSTDRAKGERRPYSRPEVAIYRDMGDLLALDPPVPGLEPIPWEDPARDRSPESP
jgi:hypothetical protein